ncbi:tripartite tricarboxylate transporter TctB family protein [Saccharospirillum sp.]|uniref:tripartite tricarboxylate transporter TctB family protein n=1 Tax=Saccharospirillum sp. TaxID=2033801 RepID=UPI0034A09B6C
MSNEYKNPGQKNLEDITVVTKEIRVAEVVFILFLLVVTIAAILESLTYSMTAARTPLVILTPLLLLIIGISVREIRAMKRESASLAETARNALAGQYRTLNQFIVFSLWLIFLIVMVIVLGQYLAIAIFTWLLMRPVGKESNSLSIKIALGLPLALYGLFDLVLNLEMFPGILYQLWAGYDVF